MPGPAPAPVTVLYDAGCGACRWSVARLLALDRGRRLRPVAIQSPEGTRLLAEVDPAVRLDSAHAVGADGVVSSGGDAAAPIAAVLPAGAPVATLLRGPAAPVARAAYRFVSRRRTAWGRLVTPGMRERADAAIARRATPPGQ